MKTTIIGFGHKARQGKDEAAKAIMEAHGGHLDIRRYGFADALKREVAGREADLCGEHGIPYEPENKHRSLLQFWGMHRRAEDKDYWVKRIQEKIEEENPEVAIITDVRFPNEHEFIRSIGGTLVCVVRRGFHDPAVNPGHISETALDGYAWDFHIDVSDGDMDGLRINALAVFEAVALAVQASVR